MARFSIENLDKCVPLDIDRGENFDDCRRCQQSQSRFRFNIAILEANSNVTATKETSRSVLVFVNIFLLVDFYDITQSNLWGQENCSERQEATMRVVPAIGVFEIGIHSWEWRCHQASSRRSSRNDFNESI